MTPFDVARFRALRAERGLALGEPVAYAEVTGSTNDLAMDAARAGAPHGATFVADEQTHGRGRRGNVWSSRRGEDLLFSVLLRPALDPKHAGTLTLAVGLGVREVIAARVDAPVRVKWPNDVLAGDAKVAGILLESQLQAGSVSAIVVGIGVNVGMREPPPELAGRATSLALLGATSLGREELLLDLLAALERRLAAHLVAGLPAALGELRAHDALLDRRVRIDGAEGVARGIAEDGALRVEDASGKRVSVSAGSVELV